MRGGTLQLSLRANLTAVEHSFQSAYIRADAPSATGWLSKELCATGASRTFFALRRCRCTTPTAISTVSSNALLRPCHEAPEVPALVTPAQAELQDRPQLGQRQTQDRWGPCGPCPAFPANAAAQGLCAAHV